jgi:hypothetical protein
MADNTNDMTTPQEPVSVPVGEPIVPAPAPAPDSAKSSGVRTVVLAGVSAVVGAVVILGAGIIGYAIGNHDDGNHREATLTVSADRNGQQGGQQGQSPFGQQGGQQSGPMMQGPGDGMMGGDGQRGIDPDGDNWTGGGRMPGGEQGQSPFGQQGQSPFGQQGGQQSGPMMQGPGAGIQDFLNQLQSGKGLTSDQQQFLDQLKGFVGGMRNQAG